MSESTDIHIDIPETTKINSKHLKRMVFVMNALEKGWAIKKVEDEYIFTKKLFFEACLSVSFGGGSVCAVP